MQVVINPGLFDRVEHLDGNENKQLLKFLKLFYKNPAHPSFSWKRINTSKGSNLWSGRISKDLRAIVYKSKNKCIFLYADHHDRAYKWAENHNIKEDYQQGNITIIECPKVEENTQVSNISLASKKKKARNNQAKQYIVDPVPLAKFLKAPLSSWRIFLHPEQRAIATGIFNGPVKITGSAGTGKTVVALHRAKYLASQGRRVLLTSFVRNLCQIIESNLKLLCHDNEQQLELITVSTVHSQAKRIVSSAGKSIIPVGDDTIKRIINSCYYSKCPINKEKLFVEWKQIISAQYITTWKEYSQANREGAGYGLTQKKRKLIWQVFELVWIKLNQKGIIDWSGLCAVARQAIESGKVKTDFDCVIVDEVQDLQNQELLLLKTLAGEGKNNLMLLGDGGQRIYPGGFNLSQLGIETRGRSRTLKNNYRNSEQIINFSHLIRCEGDDFDGEEEVKQEVFSSFTGKEPTLKGFKTQEEQLKFVVEQVSQILDEEKFNPDEIAILARTSDLLTSVKYHLNKADIPYYELNKQDKNSSLALTLANMHRVKGLEFKVVFVINVSDTLVPLQTALEMTVDAEERESKIKREQQLLYVSCTRARDQLFISWVGELSRFLLEALTQPEGNRETA